MSDETVIEKMSDNEWTIRAIFVFSIFTFYCILLMTWVAAFLNGGSIIVTINETGGNWFEMYLELIFLIVLTPVLIIGFYYFVRDIKRWY